MPFPASSISVHDAQKTARPDSDRTYVPFVLRSCSENLPLW